jgi:hypothetical protein
VHGGLPRVSNSASRTPAAFDSIRAAYQQLNADFGLKLADLSTERRRLRSVQPLRGCSGEATRLGVGDKASKMPQLHVGPLAYNVFLKNVQAEDRTIAP